MMRPSTARPGGWPARGAALLAALVLALGAALAAVTPAAATPVPAVAGKACVFVRVSGAHGLGHTGWGYQSSTSTYTYGATENPSSSMFVEAGGDIGYWKESGSFTAMVNAMKTRGYDEYTCTTVASRQPAAAAAEALVVSGGGYAAATNNCMDHTYRILTAYGVRFPAQPSWNWAPRVWFDKITDDPAWSFPVVISSPLGVWKVTYCWKNFTCEVSEPWTFKTDGRVYLTDSNGNVISGPYTSTPPAASWLIGTATYLATVDGTTMKGTMSTPTGQTGTWSAQRK